MATEARDVRLCDTDGPPDVAVDVSRLGDFRPIDDGVSGCLSSNGLDVSWSGLLMAIRGGEDEVIGPWLDSIVLDCAMRLGLAAELGIDNWLDGWPWSASETAYCVRVTVGIGGFDMVVGSGLLFVLSAVPCLTCMPRLNDELGGGGRGHVNGGIAVDRWLLDCIDCASGPTGDTDRVV